MKTKQMISAISVATVLALASPAYAGLLGGGAGGGFGGSMGGGHSGVGGGFGGHGGLNGSLDSTNAHPAKQTNAATKATAGTASKSTASQPSTTPKASAPATAATPPKPATSASVTAGSEQSISAGQRSVLRGESISAEHAPGSTSAAASSAFTVFL